MSRGTNPAFLKVWQQRINRFRVSNQTVVQFCKTENVSVPSFYQWMRRLTDWASPTQANQNRSAFAASAAPSFCEVTFPRACTRPSTIRLSNGATHELGDDTHIVEAILTHVLASANAKVTSVSQESTC